jgi:hypothetical protein
VADIAYNLLESLQLKASTYRNLRTIRVLHHMGAAIVYRDQLSYTPSTGVWILPDWNSDIRQIVIQ